MRLSEQAFSLTEVAPVVDSCQLETNGGVRYQSGLEIWTPSRMTGPGRNQTLQAIPLTERRLKHPPQRRLQMLRRQALEP